MRNDNIEEGYMKDVIIITGGSNGLGKALVEYSLNKGLMVCNLDKENLQLNNPNYKCFVGDVSNEDFINATIDKIASIGNIKYLVNNAGETSFKLPSKYTKSDIDKCFKGLQGMILATTRVLQAKNKEDLKIINIMSSAALS